RELVPRRLATGLLVGTHLGEHAGEQRRADLRHEPLVTRQGGRPVEVFLRIPLAALPRPYRARRSSPPLPYSQVPWSSSGTSMSSCLRSDSTWASSTNSTTSKSPIRRRLFSRMVCINVSPRSVRRRGLGG